LLPIRCFLMRINRTTCFFLPSSWHHSFKRLLPRRDYSFVGYRSISIRRSLQQHHMWSSSSMRSISFLLRKITYCTNGNGERVKHLILIFCKSAFPETPIILVVCLFSTLLLFHFKLKCVSWKRSTLSSVINFAHFSAKSKIILHVITMCSTQSDVCIVALIWVVFVIGVRMSALPQNLRQTHLGSPLYRSSGQRSQKFFQLSLKNTWEWKGLLGWNPIFNRSTDSIS
jgi:hypothetical protein